MIARAVWAAALAATAGPAAQNEAGWEVPLPDGRAVVEWVSPSSFRICREWTPGPRCQGGARSENTSVSPVEAPDQVIFQTQYLRAEVSKRHGGVRVTNREGTTIFEDLDGPRRLGHGISARRRAVEKERFYGLAAASTQGADLRGQIIETDWPFLISSRGYGIYHPQEGRYRFELATGVSSEWRISAAGERVFEYWFYYGPTPKEILEEHKNVVAPPPALRLWQLGVLQPGQEPRGSWKLSASPSWEGLRQSIRALVHGSLSARLVPVLDLSAYEEAPPELMRRAVALGSVVPLVVSSLPGPSADEMAEAIGRLRQRRTRWSRFFLSYADEIEVRGLPVIRPLAMQFPADEEASRVDDAFLIGDEVLAAPVSSPGGCRSVYLPMGIWTEWRTNRVHPGRRRVTACAPEDEVPLYVKNGSLVPVASEEESGLIEVHYFPKLAGEFFLPEPEANDYTQIHAAPALDTMRLEVESKVTRSYEWVVHHVSRVRQVRGATGLLREVSEGRLRDGEWRQEGENLRVRVRVAAGSTDVSYVVF